MSNSTHSFTLAPPPDLMAVLLPSQAELRSIDRTYALAKDAGVLDQLRDLRALRQQINEELAFLGEIG